MKKGLLFILLAAATVCVSAQEKKKPQRAIEWKQISLALIGLSAVALVHKCISVITTVRLVLENVLLRHLTLP